MDVRGVLPFVPISPKIVLEKNREIWPVSPHSPTNCFYAFIPPLQGRNPRPDVRPPRPTK